MWADLKTAMQEGVLIGVKWAIVVALTLTAVGWLIGDYSVVRQRALNGQQAFEYLLKVQQQQQGATHGEDIPAAPTP